MKLTIGIPTYNRARILKSTLDRLLPSVAEIEDKIEVLISDNASTDGTIGVIEDAEKKYSFIRKIVKSRNTGSADNFLNLMINAKGDFVWLFSDDDILIEGAIETIINFLETNPTVSLVHLNNYNFHGEFREDNLIGPRVKNMQTFITSDKSKFAECAGCHLTFLTTTIFNTRFLHSNLNTLIQDADEYFLQLYAAYLCTAQDNAEMGFISFPCVAARSNNSVGYNIYEVFGVHLFNALKYAWFNCGYPKKVLKKQYIKYWKDTVKGGIIGAKLKGHKDSYKGFTKFLLKSYYSINAWFTLYPFLLFPAPIYRAARKIYKKLRK